MKRKWGNKTWLVEGYAEFKHRVHSSIPTINAAANLSLDRGSVSAHHGNWYSRIQL